MVILHIYKIWNWCVQRLTEINKLWNVASCWLYSVNIFAIHGHMNVKSLIFRSLSMNPANYRQFQKDVTVSFLKFYLIRNVRTAAIDTCSQFFITPHRLCVRFCTVGVHDCNVNYISLYAKHTKEITCNNCGINNGVFSNIINTALIIFSVAQVFFSFFL